jgi:basic amino acid/polyamine antiporter, APA family
LNYPAGESLNTLDRMRKKVPNLSRPYRAWGYPWTTLIFLAAAIALTVNLWMVRPVRSSLGLAVILGGVPFFYYWRKAARASTESSEQS